MSLHFGPWPFVQPGPSTAPVAFDQPPEYHAQLTFAFVSSSPMLFVVVGSSGSFAAVALLYGHEFGWIVFTAKSPHARPATGEGQATVSAASLVGVTVAV